MTDKERALKLAEQMRLARHNNPDRWNKELTFRQINDSQNRLDAAAILRAEAEALEGVYQLIGSHSGLDARIVVLRADAAELEAG